MELLIQYWAVIIAVIACLVVAGYSVYVFAHRPTTQQILKVKEWLLYAVTEAEKEFGSNTGAIKLRYVYDKFIAKFPFLVKTISFESFSLLVDEVLEKFRHLLESNVKIQEYVNGN